MKNTILLTSLAGALSINAAVVTFDVTTLPTLSASEGTVTAVTAASNSNGVAVYTFTDANGVDSFDITITALGNAGAVNVFNLNANGLGVGTNGIGGTESLTITFSNFSGIDNDTVTITSITDNPGNTSTLTLDGSRISSSDGVTDRLQSFTLDFDVVPEPTSTALLGLGGLALVARRKR